MQEVVELKKMNVEHLDRIIEIEQGVYGDHHWPKSSFMEEINNNLSRYYVLLNSEGTVAGYYGCWHIFEEGHITNIAVAKEFQGKMYGKALLKHLIDGCYDEKIKYITLEVRKSNKPAINLYTKFGFHSFGERKGYYQNNNENAIIMWTKNIFFDEFKKNYEIITKKLEESVIIKQ